VLSVLAANLALVAALPVLLALSGYFSGSETAFFNLNRETLRTFEAGRCTTQALAARLMRRPRQLLFTVLFGNMLVNVCFYSFTALLAVRLAAVGRGGAAVGLGLGGLVAVVVFGEVVPKAIAVNFPVGVSRLSAPVMTVLEVAFRPARVVFRYSTDLILRIVAPRPPEAYVTRRELKKLVEMSLKAGHLDRLEGGALQSIFDLGGMKVREVMVPRVDMDAFDVAGSPEDFVGTARRLRRGKLPVYHDSSDKIVGVVHLNDFVTRPKPWPSLAEVAKPVEFVPESKRVGQLLTEFRRTKKTLAIVVDEYGGTAGLVTLHDVVEEIVGDIGDEYDETEEEAVRALGEDRYLLNGDFNMAELGDLFGEEFVRTRAVTLGGFVTQNLGRVPREGDRFRFANVEFVVRGVARHRVREVEIVFPENGGPAPAEEA
jgi:CBS domain containing-hemolysin-like protein